MRQIFIVNALQVVTSDNNPQGLLSVVSGYPMMFDSNNYNGDVEMALKKAKAAYYDKLGKNYDDTNPARIMTTVTLEMANGRQIMGESIGGFINVEPEPEPEPEEVVEE